MRAQLLSVLSENVLPMRFQTLVHLFLFAAVVCLIVLKLAEYSHYSFSVSSDSNIYASIGRNLMRGNGFSSDFIYPMTLKYDFARQVPQPELLRRPLFPFVLSGAFSLLGARDASIHTCNILLFCLFLTICWCWCRKRGLPPMPSTWVVVLVATHPSYCLFATNGTSEMLIFVLATSLFWILSSQHPRKALYGGALMALLHLTDFKTNVFIPFVMAYLVLSKREGRWRDIALFLGSFLMLTIPWFWRTYKLAGNPFFTMYFTNWAIGTKFSPDDSIHIQLAPVGPWTVLSHDLSGFVLKWFKGVGFYFRSMLWAHPILIMMFGWAVWVRRSSSLLLLLSIVLGSIGVYSTGGWGFDRYLTPFYPVMLILSVLELRRYDWQKLSLFRGRRSRNALTILTLLALSWNIWFLLTPRIPISIATQPVYREQISEVVQITTEKDLIISDIAPALSWYGDRAAIWIPFDLDTLKAIDRIMRPTAFHVRHSGANIPARNYPADQTREFLRETYRSIRPLSHGGVIAFVRR